jgi:hypothetical protein
MCWSFTENFCLHFHSSFHQLRRWRHQVLLTLWYISARLYDVTSQKMVFCLKCDWLSVSLMRFLRDINSNYMHCFSKSLFIDISQFTFWRGEGSGKVGVKSFLYFPPFYLHQYHSTFVSALLFTGPLRLLNMHHTTSHPHICHNIHVTRLATCVHIYFIYSPLGLYLSYLLRSCKFIQHWILFPWCCPIFPGSLPTYSPDHN